MQSGRKKYSVVWKYFTKYNENYAKCNLCGRDFSYKTTTSNLKKHIRKKHTSIQIDNPDPDATAESECFTVVVQNDNGNEIEMHEEEEEIPSSPTEENNEERHASSPIHEYLKIEPQKIRKVEMVERRPDRKPRVFVSEVNASSLNNYAMPPKVSNRASMPMSEDDDEIFAKFLTVELRKLTDTRMKNRCKRDILSIIMEYGTAQDGDPEEAG